MIKYINNPIGHSVPYQANPYDTILANETNLNIHNDSKNFQYESV